MPDEQHRTAAATRSAPVVADAPVRGRYEARIEGEMAGFAEYLRSARMIVFVHTEVDPAYEGRGVGGALVRESLDRARDQRLTVVPVCPFYAAWIARHPHYGDLLHSATSRVSD